MVATKPKMKESTNPMDERMTSAQVARRKFKSTLPRKVQNRRLSAMEALGETFTLFDRFRNMVREQGQNPDKMLRAGLAYCLPESDLSMLAATTRPLPGPSEIGAFCNEVMALDRPLFLGVVFVQFDPDTDNPEYESIAFVAQFMGGPEAEGRLLFARKMFLAGLQAAEKKRKR